MEKIEREELKEKHPNWIASIQKRHVMGPEIERELFIDNKPVKNLGHSREYFLILTSPGEEDMYIAYEMDHIIVDVQRRLLARRLLSVTLFESFQEFESERVRRMQTVEPKDQTGLNFN